MRWLPSPDVRALPCIIPMMAGLQTRRQNLQGGFQAKLDPLHRSLGGKRRRQLCRQVRLRPRNGFGDGRRRPLSREQSRHILRQTLLVGEGSPFCHPRQNREDGGVRGIRAQPRSEQQPERPFCGRAVAGTRSHRSIVFVCRRGLDATSHNPGVGRSTILGVNSVNAARARLYAAASTGRLATAAISRSAPTRASLAISS